MTALIMLDLSATFDVIDHPILLKRLEFSFGIKEKASTSVKLYLAYRTQCVSVANKTLPDVGLFGVPQGSVLRPKNYCIYANPVGEIMKRYNIKYNCYADDRQGYMTLKPCDKWDDISSSIKACIADISTWINSNMLKLNKDKTKFILFSSKQHAKKTENLSSH